MKFSRIKDATVLLTALLGVVIAHAVVPDWWTEQNVVPATVDQSDPAIIQDNYKPALIGQAKHIAYQAYLAMEAKQPGSAGPTIENMVMNFSTDPVDNYAPLIIGQLKAIAQPFYDRFSELGYDVDDIALNSNGYPWGENTPLEENYKPANLGQLKYVFSFDLGLFPPKVGIEGGLIAYWNFDEASGTTAEDASENQNSGTIMGEVERASGYGLGQSVEFDALNERVTTEMIDLGNSFTISGYFQTEYPSLDLQTLIANSQSGWQTDGFRVFLQTSTGQIRIETGNGLAGDAAFSEVGLPLLEDQWNHLAIVVERTAGQARIYFNGYDATVDSSILTDFNSNNGLSIGGLVEGGLDFQGKLDELRIYNRALTEDEINNFFGAKIGSKHVAEKANLWLDANRGIETDEAGNIVIWRDQSGFGLDGIVPTVSAAPKWIQRGHFENAVVRFDGIDDELQIPGISGAISEFTIAWYVKPKGNADFNQELRDTNGWGTFVFHTDESGNIYLGTDQAGRIVSGTETEDAPIGVFSEDHWHLMTFTFGEEVGRFYMNGELLAEKSNLAMPQLWSGLVAKINGDLGELLFYDSELDSTDIDELLEYFNEKYRFDEDKDRDGLLDKWELEEFGDLVTEDSSYSPVTPPVIIIQNPIHDPNL